MIHKVRLIAALFFAYAVAAQAGMPEALEALKKQDLDAAIVELRPIAKQGSTEAQFLLARVLYSKQNDAQSLAEALSLFQITANAGNEEAMLILAVLYEKGELVQQNQQESVRWLLDLAERSNGFGLVLLSNRYREGLGVPQSSVISYALLAVSGKLSEAEMQADRSLGARTLGLISQLVEDLRKPNNFQKALDRANGEAVLFNKMYANLPNAVKANIADADANDTQSMVRIGTLYLYGERQVPRDPKLAVYWFQKAASLGDHNGRDYMANLYLEGVGVDKDYKAAFNLFSGLVNEKHIGFEGKLGALYKDGLGVTQDFSKAHYWLRKSVGAVGENLFGLAHMYAEGAGVSKSPVVALALAKLSAMKSPQVFSLGMLVVDNPAVAFVKELKLKLSPYEVAVGSKLAGQLLSASVGDGNQLELIDLAAEKRGDAYAISPVQVASHFVHDYADEDFPLARNLLEPLIEKNDPEAQYLLGSMLEQGQGVPVNMQKANDLFDLAEAQGNVEALTRKGGIYERGEGVEQDFSKAFMAYEKAANRGGAFAQGKAAAMLADGRGVDRNTKLAIYWYEKASVNPIDYWQLGAFKGLAKIFLNERKFPEATPYLKKAAAKGDKEAQLSLAEMYFEGLGVHRSMQLAFVLAKLAQRDPAYKAKALELSAKAQKYLSADDEKVLEPLVVELSDLDHHSESIKKDAGKFLEILEAAGSSARD